MLTRSSKLYWKKQLMVFLSFVIIAAGFPAAFTPQSVNAAGPINWLTYKFDINDFSEPSLQELFQLNGESLFADGKLVVNPKTPGNTHLSGSAFNKQSFQAHEEFSFSTGFSFEMKGNLPNTADGMTFAIVNDLERLGGTGGGLGIGEVQPSFALKFDTYTNTNQNDPSNNYIGIAINGNLKNEYPSWFKDLNAPDMRDASNNPKFVLANGKTYYAWIDYDGASKNVKVYFNDSASKPSDPLIDADGIDLKEIFEGTNAIYTGFTGVGYNESHEILSWYFVNDFAPIGDLNDTSQYQQAPSSLEMEVGASVQGAYPIVITAKDAKDDPVANAPITVTSSQAGSWKDAAGNPITDWSTVTTDDQGKVTVYFTPDNVLDASDLRAVAVGGAIATGTITAVKPSPGGVSNDLISWVDVERSAVISGTKIDELTDLADNGTWMPNDTTPNDNVPNAMNFNGGIHINSSRGYYVRSANDFANDSARELFSVQSSINYSGFPWELGGTYDINNKAVYGDVSGKNIRTYFGRNEGYLNIHVGDYELKNGAMLNVWSAPDDWALSLNGNILHSEDDNTPNFTSPVTSPSRYYFGAGHSNRFNGMMAETILFNRKLNDDERNRVNSYLALKYGLTLKGDNNTLINYVASNGSTMWTADANTGYGNRITGIGRDDVGALYQKQSKSQVQGANVTIALGDEIQETNASNLNNIANDKSFFVFSDNGLDAKFVASLTKDAKNLKHMERVYKVEKTNWQDTDITLQVDKLDGAAEWPLYLVVSSDEQFDQNDAFYPLTDGKAEINSSSFANGAYFTVAAVAPVPTSATIEQTTADVNTITLTFDQDVELTDLTGFTITIDGKPVSIADVTFKVVDTDATKLMITLPAGTDVTDKEVEISYNGLGNLNGTSGVPVDQFVIKDFGSTLTITEPNTDSVTVTKPEIKGTAEPGSIVKVVIKSQGQEVDASAEITVDENGNWTFTPNDSLIDGPYTIEVTATKDGATATKTKEINVAIPVPTVEVTTPVDKAYTSKPVFAGTATPGAMVTVKVTDDLTLTATADENGNWSVTSDTDLPDGTYDIEVTATREGKSSTPVSKTIEVDTTLPAVAIDRPSGDKVFNAKPEFAGTATPGAAIKVKITDDITLTTTADENGKWSVTPATDLPDGTYHVVVTATKDSKSSEISKNVTVETSSTGNVDKSALEKKANEIEGKITAGELTDSDYTQASWDNLKRALDEAERILNDPTATQEEVDQALAALEQAEKDLVKLNGELDELNLVGLNQDGEKGITLTPAFDPNQYKNYSGTVTNDVYGISLNPKAKYPDDTQVKVFVNGKEYPADQWDNLPLVEGKENVIKVGVYDKAGQPINEYTYTIFRESTVPANNKLESLVPSVGSLSPAFDPNQESYTMSVANSVNQLQFTPTAEDPNATIQIQVNEGEWKTVTSGELSGYLALNVGPNVIAIKVTDQNGKEKTYFVTVTRAPGNDNSGGGNTGGGGTGNTGGTIPPPTTDNTAKPGNIVTTDNGSNVSFASGTVNGDQTTVTIDKNKLSGILADGKGHKLGIRVPGNGNVEVQGLTVEDLKKLADTGSSLEIEDVLAIYPVPAGQLDVNAISRQFGNAPISAIAANIKIKRSADDLAKLANEKAAQGGYELLVHPVDLDLTFNHDGKTDRAGVLNGYAPKYIALPEGIDPNRITTGVIVNPDGSVFHVPTVVTKVNNRYFALINDLRSSGTYSVIWNPQDFEDVQYHWGRADVNNIAARLDLKGNGDNTFSPNRHVTRSEFAEILVLGLGLMRQDAPQNIFPDVPASAWYRNAVALADEFGIVRGYTDGNFKGGQQITREQGFAMIARAYRLIQSEDVPSQEQIASTLAPYADGAKVASWAKADVAQLINAGIIQGNGPKHISPKEQMTRAEVTALLARMLKVTDLIDK